MQAGMMWYDNAKGGLEAKLERAADYYRQKYGRLPNFCLVHPGALAQFGVSEAMVGKIAVREFKSVMPNHLWIGIEFETDSITDSRIGTDGGV